VILIAEVAFVKVKHEEFGVQKAVKKAMNLANWKKHVKGKKIFLKVNAISDQLVPGQCTSPWVIDAVLSEVRKEFPEAEINIGDVNVATAKQLNSAAKLWGFLDLAKKHRAGFVNLSESESIEADVGGKILHEISIPKVVMESDCIINLPVAKTHCLTTISCCLKNHWGLVPRFRHQYHLVADQAIADVNKFFKKKTVLNVVDATVCMEGNGPRTGEPKICDLILASNDRVALDAAVAKYMGFDPYRIEHIKLAEEIGVGERKYNIVGDDFYINRFKPPDKDKQPVFFWELRMRKIPVLNALIFRTKIFDFFAWVVTQYNSSLWYNSHGKKYAKAVIENSWYGNEFKELWDRTGGTGKLDKSTQ
jgi:uncharacterized protein (DUF362 family)